MQESLPSHPRKTENSHAGAFNVFQARVMHLWLNEQKSPQALENWIREDGVGTRFREFIENLDGPFEEKTPEEAYAAFMSAEAGAHRKVA